MVLAVEAVKGTGMVKHRQIAVADFRSPGDRILRISAAGTGRADKITHTVGGQRIKIKVKIALVRPAAAKAAVLHPPQAAEPGLAFRYPAVVNAQTTRNSISRTGRVRRQAIGRAAAVVNRFDLGPDRIKMNPDTIGAESDGV